MVNIGDKFHRLTVMLVGGPRGGRVKVRCECGNETEVMRCHLVKGNNKSCGCWKVDCAKERFTKHGAIKRIDKKRVTSPEYRTWQALRNRCLNPASQDYTYYGARGITVCDRWLSFENFLQDMGERPGPGYTLDRINSDGGYSKENCRWTTRREQARNRAYAKTKSWLLAEILGVKIMTAHHYIWQVRSLDRGKPRESTKGIQISVELEGRVRKFMQEHNI